MAERRFIVTKQAENFLLGRFEGETTSGAYLSPEYLGRLRQITNAVIARSNLFDKGVPDAFKNLMGVLNLLTNTHAAQVTAEGGAPSDADIEERARLLAELEELATTLGGLPTRPSGPDEK